MRSVARTTLFIVAGLLLGSGWVFFALGWFGGCVLLISGLVSLAVWHKLFLPVDDAAHMILSTFCASAAGFLINLIEEFAAGYAPAISRIFGFAWTERSFVTIALGLAAALFIVAIGLHARRPLAGYFATYFLISRLAELSMFLFPFVPPAVHPELPGPVTESLGGVVVANMPNHFLATSGIYYFPGMFTVALTIVPAIYAVLQLRRAKPIA